jgi:signal transduction histidine kinase
LNEPELLKAAAAASRLALHSARLTAQVRAQLDELQRSRTRLVLAVDQQRRRLERDLHDGVRQQLLTVALELGRLHQQVAGHATLDSSDDGQGGAQTSDGSGLQGLEDRVAALGGTISLDSPRGRGTRLHVDVPLGST